MIYTQSDDCIVPMRLRNPKGISSGGKVVTSGNIARRHRYRTQMTDPAEQRKRGRKLVKTGHQSDGEPDAGKLHVRICEGLGGAISFAYSPHRLEMASLTGLESAPIEMQRNHPKSHSAS